jgi:Flp pilus assembly protein TadD
MSRFLRVLQGVMVGVSVLLSACAQQTSAQRAASTFAQFQRELTKEQLLERGKMFSVVGDHTRAEQYFTSAIEAGADELRVFPLLLASCLNDGRLRLAAQYSEDYLKRHPNDVRVRLVLGTIYSAIGENTLAEVELRRVIAQQPTDAQAHYALATLLREARPQQSEAEVHYREYLRLAPNGDYAPQVRETLQQGER